ncbi:MAG: hypothetical protein V1674_05030 [Candidatus Omnitrophota bacterium]
MSDFAIIIHPTSEELLHRYEPGMKKKPRQVVKKLLEWMAPFKASDVKGLRSVTGKTLDGYLVMCPLLMEQMISLNPRKVLKAIANAGELASKLGVKIIGLGAYAALIGNKGLELAQKIKIPITTGAAYTLAMIPEAILRAMKILDVEPEKAKVLFIGSANNVVTTCIDILGHSFNRIYLNGHHSERIDNYIRQQRKDKGINIEKINDISEVLAQADVIVVATNRIPPAFDVHKLKPKTIVFDVSYPRKVPNNLRDDILVIDGLAVRPPGEVDFNFDFGLPRGLSYPCMAEPLVLAFENRFESYSLGREIPIEKVREISRLASKHGFEIVDFTSQDRLFSTEQVKQIKTNAQKTQTSKRTIFSTPIF